MSDTSEAGASGVGEDGQGQNANSQRTPADSREAKGGARFLAATAVLLAGVGGAALLLAHCTRSRPTDPGEVARQDGARLYRTYCGLCHGDEGEGYAADDANALANQDFLVSVSDTFLQEAIAYGHPGTAMAAYADSQSGPLTEGEIDNLVQFIRAWQEESTVTLDPAPIEGGDVVRGRAAYARDCASCHGDRGGGESALSLRSPIFLRTASDAQIDYAIRHGRRGTPMPAFEGELSEQTLKDLVALIRSWEAPAEEPQVTAPDEVGAGPVVLNPDGEHADFELREGRYVASEDLARAIENGRRLVILDARPPSDYVRFHVVGAIPSPYYAVSDVMDRLPRDGTWVIAYCACPHAASGRVMDYLRDHDFEHTAVIDEGVLHWNDEGFPVVTGPSPGTMADAE